MSEFQKIKDTVSMYHVLDVLRIKRGVTKNYHCINTTAHYNGDNRPSMSVLSNKRVYCHACQYKGDIFDVWQLVDGGTRVDALNALRNLSDQPRNQKQKPFKEKKESHSETLKEENEPVITSAELAKYANITHQNLMNDQNFKDGVIKYGYSIEAIEHFKLGKCNNHNHLTIPIKINGIYHDIRRYSTKKDPKYSAWKRGTGSNVFWGMDAIDSDTRQVYLTTGISDRISFFQTMMNDEDHEFALGEYRPAIICPTTGENSINLNQFKKTGLIELLRNKNVFYVPDNDEAGRQTIPRVVQDLVDINAIVEVVDLSECGKVPTEQRKDLKDFFIKEKKSLLDFKFLGTGVSSMHTQNEYNMNI